MVEGAGFRVERLGWRVEGLAPATRVRVEGRGGGGSV